MTPEERQDAEAAFLDEYEERTACLGILDQRLRDTGERMREVGRAVQRGERIMNTDDLDAALGAFVETLADYRRTRSRADALYHLLRDRRGTVLKPVDYPER